MIVAAVVAASLTVQRPSQPPPRAEQPAIIRDTAAAIAARDGDALGRLFRWATVADANGRERRVASREVVAMLAACTLGETRQLFGPAYTISLPCPARRKTATGCDSGDLYLVVRDARPPSLQVASGRKHSAACPVYAPPPPPLPPPLPR